MTGFAAVLPLLGSGRGGSAGDLCEVDLTLAVNLKINRNPERVPSADR